MLKDNYIKRIAQYYHFDNQIQGLCSCPRSDKLIRIVQSKFELREYSRFKSMIREINEIKNFSSYGDTYGDDVGYTGIVLVSPGKMISYHISLIDEYFHVFYIDKIHKMILAPRHYLDAYNSICNIIYRNYPKYQELTFKEVTERIAGFCIVGNHNALVFNAFFKASTMYELMKYKL